jgi:tetrahydromethanopterin S-methyltransferase subunit G
MMDNDTDKEFNRVNTRIDKVEDKQLNQQNRLEKLARDILRFWHLGVGVGLGLIVKELGVDKLLGHVL